MNIEDFLRVAAGFSVAKGACRVAATSAVTMSGPQTVDAVDLVAGDRVLRAIGTSADNGIYIVSSAEWERAVDMSTDAFLVLGALVPVLEGTEHAGSLWMMTQPTTIRPTLGDDELEFSKV